MEIATAHSTREETRDAVQEACQQLRRRLDSPPAIIFAHWSSLYDGREVQQKLRQEFPASHLQGASSCQGAMTEEGVISRDGRGLALLGLSDPEGAYGVAGGVLDREAGPEAAAMVLQAVENAGRPGEMPDLVRISATPGRESEVIAGIESVLGPEVPIIGGSAADNEVSGRWAVFDRDDYWSDGLVVTVLYPSTTVAFAFHNGYSPTLKRGRVTKASGRLIEEIDHRPAARVYNEWTGGLIDQALANQGSVLADTTLYPLGRVVGEVGGVPYFSLAHPDQVTAGDGLSLFTDIKVGDEVILMRGTFETLISRAGRVAQAALQAGRLGPDEICGGLIVYCAGCMLTVRERLDEVAASLNTALGHRPFLGSFTFGEQGCFPGGENRHANLMISAVVFAKNTK